MMYATCRTDECPANGVVIPIELTLAEGESVFCGRCGYPCELNEAAPKGDHR